MRRKNGAKESVQLSKGCLSTLWPSLSSSFCCRCWCCYGKFMQIYRQFAIIHSRLVSLSFIPSLVLSSLLSLSLTSFSKFHTLNKTKPKVKYANGKQRGRAIMAMTATKNANKSFTNARETKRHTVCDRKCRRAMKKIKIKKKHIKTSEKQTLSKSYSLRLM